MSERDVLLEERKRRYEVERQEAAITEELRKAWAENAALRTALGTAVEALEHALPLVHGANVKAGYESGESLPADRWGTQVEAEINAALAVASAVGVTATRGRG